MKSTKISFDTLVHHDKHPEKTSVIYIKLLDLLETTYIIKKAFIFRYLVPSDKRCTKMAHAQRKMYLWKEDGTVL